MTCQRVLQATKNIWNWFCLHTYTKNRSPNLKAKTMKNRDGIFSQRPTMTYEPIQGSSPLYTFPKASGFHLLFFMYRWPTLCTFLIAVDFLIVPMPLHRAKKSLGFQVSCACFCFPNKMFGYLCFLNSSTQLSYRNTFQKNFLII